MAFIDNVKEYGERIDKAFGRIKYEDLSTKDKRIYNKFSKENTSIPSFENKVLEVINQAKLIADNEIDYFNALCGGESIEFKDVETKEEAILLKEKIEKKNAELFIAKEKILNQKKELDEVTKSYKNLELEYSNLVTKRKQIENQMTDELKNASIAFEQNKEVKKNKIMTDLKPLLLNKSTLEHEIDEQKTVLDNTTDVEEQKKEQKTFDEIIAKNTKAIAEIDHIIDLKEKEYDKINASIFDRLNYVISPKLQSDLTSVGTEIMRKTGEKNQAKALVAKNEVALSSVMLESNGIYEEIKNLEGERKIIIDSILNEIATEANKQLEFLESYKHIVASLEGRTEPTTLSIAEGAKILKEAYTEFNNDNKGIKRIFKGFKNLKVGKDYLELVELKKFYSLLSNIEMDEIDDYLEGKDNKGKIYQALNELEVRNLTKNS